MRSAACRCALALAASTSALVPPSFAAEREGRGLEKVAVLSLAGLGGGVPPEAVGKADRAIRRIFSDVGRLEVLGVQKRLSRPEAEDLAAELAASRRPGSAADPGSFGAGAFSEAELADLRGASLLAVPIVTSIETDFIEDSSTWETYLAAEMTIFDLRSPEGSAATVAVESRGYDDGDPEAATTDALGSLPGLLRYELGKAGVLRPGARAAAVTEKDLVLEIGAVSGARPGDEYELLAAAPGPSGAEAESACLVAVANAGPETSRCKILYSDGSGLDGARFAEVPRLGVDFEPYLRLLLGRAPDLARSKRGDAGASAVAGMRLPISRGFYGLRPYAAAQVPAGGVRGCGSAFVFPLDLLVGAEYRAERGRLTLVPYGGVGAGFVYASETIRGDGGSSSESPIPHFGGQAYLHLAFLASRDIRLFVEVGGEYWFSAFPDLYTDYGGVGIGAGVSIKL